MNSFVNNHFINLDKIRDELAKKGKLLEFKKTYNLNSWGKNDNNSGFWEKRLHFARKELLESNIYRDKLKIVHGWLMEKTGNILDIGFGAGDLERELNKDTLLSVFGIDISKTLVKNLARSTGGVFKVGSILSIPFKRNTFDYIVALDVLEHIPSQKNPIAFKEIFRVLKRGGTFISSVPLNEGLEEMLNKGQNPNAHLRVYTPSIFEMEHRVNRFKIVKEKYLYAFKTHYFIKSKIAKIIKIRKPNLIIILSKK